VEAHAEEERARSVNLDGGHAGGGVDLNGGRTVEAHAEEEEEQGARREPRRRARRWHGPRPRARGAKEERGTSVEAVGAALRRTWRRSRRWWVCGGEMTGLGFRGSDTLKKKNSSDGQN
jgi:hypothetical protein